MFVGDPALTRQQRKDDLTLFDDLNMQVWTKDMLNDLVLGQPFSQLVANAVTKTQN